MMIVNFNDRGIQDYELLMIVFSSEGKLYPDGLEDNSDTSYMSDAPTILKGSTSVKAAQSSRIKKKAIFTAKDLALMKNLCLDEFPIALSQWHIDPFPDGVMSLTTEARTKLRKGGKAEIYQRDGTRLNFLWKAAHDLVYLIHIQMLMPPPPSHTYRYRYILTLPTYLYTHTYRRTKYTHTDTHIQTNKQLIFFRLFQWKILPMDAKEKDELDPTYPFDIAASRFTNLSVQISFDFFDKPAYAERSGK